MEGKGASKGGRKEGRYVCPKLASTKKWQSIPAPIKEV